MTRPISEKINCPGCGHKQKTTIWTSVNADLNPELRDQILDWSFFNSTCEKCGETRNLIYPFLYHDMRHKFMIRVVLVENEDEFGSELDKLSDEQQSAVETFSREFPDATRDFQKYRHRAVIGPQELVEKIFIFENGFNDYAIEMLKHTMFLAIGKKGGADSIAKMLFDCSSGQPRLVAFMDDGELGTIDFNQKLYDDFVNLLGDYSADQSGRLQVINQAWADEFVSSLS